MMAFQRLRRGLVLGALSTALAAAFPGAASAWMYVKQNRLRALGICSLKPSALFPGVPTVSDSGLRGYESVSPQGIVAPAKTPAAIIARLNQELVKALNRAETRQRLGDLGIEVVADRPVGRHLLDHPILSILLDLRDSRVELITPLEPIRERTRLLWSTRMMELRQPIEGSDLVITPQAPPTVDQFAADKLGETTMLRSLEIALESNFSVGNCDNGYSCAYSHSLSWRGEATPVIKDCNPQSVFDRLFAAGRAAMVNTRQTGRL